MPICLARGSTDASGMNLTLDDVALLKQLKAAGETGRTVRVYNVRLALDRLAKGGYVIARPTGLDLVHYRITGRGQEALAEHD
jgi:DNA-binding PadR family transcriptional regulator